MRQKTIFSLLLTLLLSAVTAAQTAPASKAKVSIIIDREAVSFAPQEAAIELHLLVTDQSGAAIYDSGLLAVSTLDWPLRDSQGESVKGGLYLYTLTIKNLAGETSERRGYLIVNRTGDADRVWVATSDKVALGAGQAAAQVTVVSSNDATVGGAELPGAVPRRDTSEERPESPQRPDTETAIKKPNTPAVVNGTNNRVAKFAADGSTLVDTQLSESNGALVVGNAGATGNLQIFGQAVSDVFAGMGPDVNNGPALNFGYAGSSFGRSAGFFNVRPDASAVAPNPSLRFLTANQQRMIITNTGNVGIGTTNPDAKLSITATGDGAKVLHLGTERAWVFKQLGTGAETALELTGANPSNNNKHFVINTDGNVRIGTGATMPQAKLDVRGDVKLGSSGQYFAPGGEENLRIIRGTVGDSGNIIAGSGFTVSHPETGQYTITFDTPFAAPPIVTATLRFTGFKFILASVNTAASTDILIGTGAASYQNGSFYFIAIGPR